MNLDLIVFLGNPGSEYAKNRHNAGRLVADAFDVHLSWTNKFKGLFCSAPLAAFAPSLPGGAHFLKPETFMNLSGESVRAAAAFYKIPAAHILVVHDELELPLGTAAFKFSGGLGGHNGLRSIKGSLGTADFWRLRIGIGRPAGGRGEADVAGWVLSNFSAGEGAVLERVLPVCAAALAQAMVSGPDELLPEWNKKKIV
ncbi:MAG: aminoacyl-tRNA hydrolase [Spirochaetaceae bacterium]|jgi:PTH1 family peptidyl-tRNA hydrolase|nr:aminoacyl-tRNA hydrolase [Spirochaetaceae bacterium]